jgi:hypothetical protein
MNPKNPNKKDFEYYDPNFKFDKNSKLRTEKRYVLFDNTGADVLIFFSDGYLNNYLTPKLEQVPIARSESGIIMGYYKLKGDSIFFTTRSFYQRKPTIYKGIISADTLKLECKFPSKKKPIQQKYVLF